MSYVRGFLLLMLATALLACSPEDESSPASWPSAAADNAADDYNDSADHYDDNADHYDDSADNSPDLLDTLRAQGWRPGRISVSLEVEQQGSAETHSAGQGGTRTVVDWRFTLNASLDRPAWVPPDLASVLPDYTHATLPRNTFEDIVFYIPDNAPAPRVSGVVSYHKNQVIHTPNANDFASMTELVDASGAITRLQLDDIKPSRYGQGFETGLQLMYSPRGKRLISSVGARGSSHRSEEPCCENGELQLRLFPQPDTTVLPRLTDDNDAAMPEVWLNQRRQLEADMLAALVELIGTDNPRLHLHPGMTSRVTADELQLDYTVSGARLPPLGEPLDFAVAPPEHNRLKLVITVTAQQP